MSGILDQMLQSQQFTPTTVEEYIALQLAKRLCDEPAIKRYVHYAANYTAEQLLRLFHRAKKEPEPARVFHASLTPHDP